MTGASKKSYEAPLSPEEILESVAKRAEYARWVGRKVSWVARYFTYKVPQECILCTRQDYCKRLRANILIQKKILHGELCPDAYSVWNEIFR